MLLATTASDPDTESKYIQMAKQDKVAGIIALTYKPTLTVTEPLPFVSIDRYYSTAIPCVASDNFGGGESMVLVDYGETGNVFEISIYEN